jgi:hypothetical protein
MMRPLRIRAAIVAAAIRTPCGYGAWSPLRAQSPELGSVVGDWSFFGYFLIFDVINFIFGSCILDPFNFKLNL